MLIKVLSFTGYEIFSFSMATIIIILGIALFNYGADNAMTPIGKKIGKGLTKQGKIRVLFLAVFIFVCFLLFISIFNFLSHISRFSYGFWVKIVSFFFSNKLGQEQFGNRLRPSESV